jgi:hypothetical protein
MIFMDSCFFLFMWQCCAEIRTVTGNNYVRMDFFGVHERRSHTTRARRDCESGSASGVADSCKYLPELEFVNQGLLDMHII